MLSLNLSRRSQTRLLIAVGVVTALTAALYVGITGKVSAAACQQPAVNYGSVTTSVSVPETATYRIWTRINTTNASNNTYLLEVDGNNCYNVGGSGLQTNRWTWVSYRDGTTSSRVDVQLSKGSHTLKLIGNKSGVKIDRLVFASDLSCTPQTADGSECNVPDDNTPPTVQLTAPAAGSSVSNTVNITATAADDVAVSKVEFYVNNVLAGTDTSSPYSYSWDTLQFVNESHLLEVRAYDAAGNVGRQNYRVTVQNGDREAPTPPTNVTATATAHNSVQVSWKAGTDNQAVTRYSLVRNGIPFAELGNVTSYADTSVQADTVYTYRVIAIDAAGNKSTPSALVSVTTPKIPQSTDSQPPTKPANLKATAVSSRQIDLTWQASTDDTAVVRYDIYRRQGSGTAQKIGSSQTTAFGDSTLAANTSYTYYVVALDGAGNTSDRSSTATAKTKTPVANSGIQGTLRDQRTKKPLPLAVVIDDHNGHQSIYMTDSKGNYRITDAKPGKRVLAYHAHGYRSAYHSLTLGENEAVTKNVTLRK